MVALALLVGATVQTLVGVGLALVAAPVVTLVDATLMPALMLWLACIFPVLTLASERSAVDWRGLGWAMPPRVVGTFLGVLVVATLPARAIGVVVGVMVLAAVALTWRAVRVPITRVTLAGAGLVAGVTGTATSIGGPPLALLYQHRPPRQIRSTLAVFFMAGAGLSLTGLAVAGELELRHLLLAAALVPVLLLGTVLGAVLRPRLPAEQVRTVVLLVCAASALALLVRTAAPL